VVGRRQVLKALRAGRLERLYVAADAAPAIAAELIGEALACGVAVDRSLDLARLGRAGGVEVGAAAVGVLRDPEGDPADRPPEP
jgi:large subunit ribosomal protein L7A